MKNGSVIELNVFGEKFPVSLKVWRFKPQKAGGGAVFSNFLIDFSFSLFLYENQKFCKEKCKQPKLLVLLLSVHKVGGRGKNPWIIGCFSRTSCKNQPAWVVLLMFCSCKLHRSHARILSQVARTPWDVMSFF